MKKRQPVLATKEDREAFREIQLVPESELTELMRKRRTALWLARNSENSLLAISNQTGLSVPTIQRLISTCRKHGPKSALSLNYKGRTHTYLSAYIESYIRKGIEEKRWKKPREIYADLTNELGVEVRYKTLWSWLSKLGWKKTNRSYRSN